jgi:hypothetical protein
MRKDSYQPKADSGSTPLLATSKKHPPQADAFLFIKIVTIQHNSFKSFEEILKSLNDWSVSDTAFIFS